MTINTMHQTYAETVNLRVGMTVATPPALVEALEVLHPDGGGMLYAQTLPQPLFLIGLGNDRLHGSGSVPIEIGGALALTNFGPVIRFTLTIFDIPNVPFLAESFINITDEWELNAMQEIVRSKNLNVVAFQHRTIQRILSVAVKPGASPNLQDLLAQATSGLVQLTPEQLDWTRARAEAEEFMPN